MKREVKRVSTTVIIRNMENWRRRGGKGEERRRREGKWEERGRRGRKVGGRKGE